MKQIEITLPELQYQAREKIKELRTNLMFAPEGTQVIMITSCVTNEGKSSIAVQLAKALAELRYNTLLIDADLRKSVMERYTGAQGVEYGLSHFLSGQCGLTDALNSTNIPNLSLIFSGVFPPNPAEL